MSHRALGDPRRLNVLRDLAILDTSTEPAYDDIAALAAAACDSPIAAVNFVDADRHWTKAAVGVEPGGSVAADLSFCAATVQAPGGHLVLGDAHAEDGWRDHPLVVGGPRVRFYAGASIVVGGEPVGVVCVFGSEPREVTDSHRRSLEALARQAATELELRSRNAELRELAVHDPLTGLANRTLLLDRLQSALARREREGGEIGLLFCDLDDFKQVNDRHGHEAGDRVLRLTAERLRVAVRPTDTVARFAGDEFVVVCPGLAAARELEAIVARVQRAVHAPGPGPAPPPRLSIGAVLVGEDEPAADALRRADEAMYAAKRAV
mgnify:CR=1 FL=1